MRGCLLIRITDQETPIANDGVSESASVGELIHIMRIVAETVFRRSPATPVVPGKPPRS
jgi:hypothetical protein